jgi:hypothetical protein
MMIWGDMTLVSERRDPMSSMALDSVLVIACRSDEFT